MLISELNSAIHRQQRDFGELQVTADDLVESELCRSWLGTLDPGWANGGYQVLLSVPPPIRSSPSDTVLNLAALQRQAIALINQRLALLMSEVLLLQLKLASFVGPDLAALQTSRVAVLLFPSISTVLKGPNLAVHKLLPTDYYPLPNAKQLVVGGLTNWEQELDQEFSPPWWMPGTVRLCSVPLGAWGCPRDIPKLMQAHGAIPRWGAAGSFAPGRLDQQLKTTSQALALRRRALPSCAGPMGHLDARGTGFELHDGDAACHLEDNDMTMVSPDVGRLGKRVLGRKGEKTGAKRPRREEPGSVVPPDQHGNFIWNAEATPPARGTAAGPFGQSTASPPGTDPALAEDAELERLGKRKAGLQKDVPAAKKHIRIEPDAEQGQN